MLYIRSQGFPLRPTPTPSFGETSSSPLVKTTLPLGTPSPRNIRQLSVYRRRTIGLKSNSKISRLVIIIIIIYLTFYPIMLLRFSVSLWTGGSLTRLTTTSFSACSIITNRIQNITNASRPDSIENGSKTIIYNCLAFLFDF